MKTIYRYAAGPGEEIRETVRQTDLYEYYKMVNAFLGDVIIEKAFQKEGNFGGERLYMSDHSLLSAVWKMNVFRSGRSINGCKSWPWSV
ncbi:MAG: hypothetical protein ACLU30_01405 [Odoribacter splanchnicus]